MRSGARSTLQVRVRQIEASGFGPIFVKLEVCRDKEAALMAEIFWIEHFKWRGARQLYAQGFSGYAAREGERQSLEQGVSKKTRAKKRTERLEAVANGRPSRQGSTWTKRDDALLAKLDKWARALRKSPMP